MFRKPRRQHDGAKTKGGIVAAVGPAARLLGIGWYFVFVVVGGAGVGWWVGQRFEGGAAQVITTLIGVGAGVALAAIGGAQFVRETVSEANERTEGDGGTPGA